MDKINYSEIWTVLDNRQISRLFFSVSILAGMWIYAFDTGIANAGNDEKIYLKLGNMRHSGIRLQLPLLRLSYYRIGITSGDAWHLKEINKDMYLLQHKNWKNFYWKIDAVNNTVYKLNGNVSDYSGETGTAINNIIFDPSDTIFLYLSSSYIELDTSNESATLVFGDTELAGKEDFELKRISPSIFHLKGKFWKKFWEINIEQNKVYLVEEETFGTSRIEKKAELDIQVSRDLSGELQAKSKSDKSDEIVIPFNGKNIMAKGYEITYNNPISFTVPTLSMLLKYRPYVRSHFGYDESKYSFFDIVNDVSYKISVAKMYEGKVWVGFSFYEGEGFEGFGGIGFYDIKKDVLGVLRHPALVDCSVKDLLVDSGKIYIQTVGNYELESTICNGIVVIDQKELNVEALVPPDGDILWSKDEEANAADFYERPIEEVYKHTSLITKPIKSWDEQKTRDIRKIGLEQYMVNTAKWEMAERNKVIKRNGQITKRIVTLKDKITESNENITVSPTNSEDSSVGIKFAGASGGVGLYKRNPTRLCPTDWYAKVYFTASDKLQEFKSPMIYLPFAAIPPTEGTYWIYAEKGKKWKFETSKHVFDVMLKDFETKPLKCFTEGGRLMDNRYFGINALFDSITFDVLIKELRN